MKKLLIPALATAIALTACTAKPKPAEESSSSRANSVYPSSSSQGTMPSSAPQTKVDQGAIDQSKLQALLNQLMNNDVYFDYDDAGIKPEGRDLLQKAAVILKQNPKFAVTLEGHADERGTEEYNLALGGRRAGSVLDYLSKLGVKKSSLQTISKGKSEPKVEGHDESAWSQNRRVHFVVTTK